MLRQEQMSYGSGRRFSSRKLRLRAAGGGAQGWHGLEALEQRMMLDGGPALGELNTDGLVGWWSFNNTANLGQDSSPNNNQLQPFGGATFNNAGKSGAALQLDGVNDVLAIDNAGVPLETGVPTGFPLGGAAYTLSAWIKPSASGNRGIIGWGSYGTTRGVNAFRTAGTANMVNYWWGADISRPTAPVNLYDGQWHHVATTWDGTTRTMWVDGNSIGSDSIAAPNVTAANFRIGRTYTALNEFFSGLLDDVAVWNKGLTATQIQALATGTAPNDLPLPPQPTLEAHWVADNLNGSLSDGAAVVSWADSLGAISAASTGSPILEKGELNGHSVVRFDPSNGADQLRVLAGANPLSNAAAFSVAVVFRTTTAGAAGTNWYQNTGIIDSELAGTANDWGMVMRETGEIGVGMGNPDRTLYSTTSLNLNDGQAHVAIFTRNGATMTLVIDGKAALQRTDAGTANRATADLVFGSLQSNTNYFTGDIAEIRIYENALTTAGAATLASELATTYGIDFTAIPQPVGFWTFDNAANLGDDVSIRNSDLGVFGDQVTYNAGGRFDGALSLGGSQDYLALSNAGAEITNAVPTAFPTGNSPYTISAWIKPNITGDRGIIGWGNYGGGRQVNAFRLMGDNGFRHYWWGADLDRPDASPVNLDDGAWHHSVATYDGVTRRLYLDGVLIASDVPGVNGATAQNFRLGNTNFTENFSGLMDDVAVWNVGLAVDQITALASGAKRPRIVNAAPVAGDDGYNGTEDQPLMIAAPGVLANDTDAEMNPLTAMLVGNAGNGHVALNADGSFTYTPNANFFGVDSFTYRARDTRDSNLATVTLTIAGAYDSSVPVNDVYVAGSATLLSVAAGQGLLANDLNPDLVAGLTVELVGDVAHGALTLNPDGSFTYESVAGYYGTDSFTYRIFENPGYSATTGTVTINIDAPPVAAPDAYQVNEDGALTVLLAMSVLANDSDLEMDPLTAILVASPLHGQLVFNADGTFTYTPQPNYSGADSFTYRASDGDQLSNLATVTLTVQPINDPPTALPDQYFGFRDELLVVGNNQGLLANDQDVDGPSLTALLVDNVTVGVLNLSADGSFSYQPPNGFTGLVTFTYRAFDGLLTTGAITVSMSITVPNPGIIINEIHYEPPDITVPEEFIELYNTESEPIDISGWQFSDGIDYTFPFGTIIPAQGYLIVASNPAQVLASFGLTALGPWQGKLSNEGENIELRNSAGDVMDEVDYKVQFPWPIGSAGGGGSMELINPSLDNNLGGSWRTSGYDTVGTPDVVLFAPQNTQWHYRKGLSEASTPTDAWTQLNFVEDGSWLIGQTPIGYADGDDLTVLTDMQNAYSTVYLRNTFNIASVEAIPTRLTLRVYVDDGAIVWLNGQEVGRFFVSAGFKAFNSLTGVTDHEAAWAEIELNNVGSLLNVGQNIIAIHGLNQTLASSDFSIDASLVIPGTQAGVSEPTPAARNSVYALNAAPHIRQVKHSIDVPGAGQSNTITAKVTDPQGVALVLVLYQVVQPGAYEPAFLARTPAELKANPDAPRLPNPAFENPANWAAITMMDNGTLGDEVAGDGIYTAVLPGQVNRALVRYRITVEDALGESIRVPYSDDDSLNFAYYVYNGIPDYVTNGGTYSAQTLETLPVYSLITRQADIEDAIAYDPADQLDQFANMEARFKFNWEGTMVYDGKVYDHIDYRLRGANGRYQGQGKRNWRFNFNKGNYLQAKDQNGDPYPTQWKTINTGRGFTNRLTNTYALNEAVNMYMWNQLGVPAPFNHYAHFRVVDGANEAPDQWFGDFWGLTWMFENYDANFLDAHDLPKGNLYKLVNSTTNALEQQRYQAAGAVSDGSDHDNIQNNLRSSQTTDWLLDHVNYDEWFQYHALVQAIRHYDYWPSANKNAAWYFAPSTETPLGQLWMLPFDTDSTWGPSFNNGEDRPYDAIFPTSSAGGDSGQHPELQHLYRNAVRNLRDLLWQQDQIFGLIDDFASQIAAFIPADLARWLNAPAAAGNMNGISAPGGNYSLATYVQDMKNFAFTGGSWPGGGEGAGGRAAFLDSLQASGGDSGLIPFTPTISYTGLGGFPADGLAFSTTAFADPQGAGTFGAIEWRLAEITDPSAPGYDPNRSFKLELNADWESGEQTLFSSSATIPGTVVQAGLTYRARVRMMDSTGRWSHWSAPVQFTATDPVGAQALIDHLRVTEIMYNPVDPPAGSPFGDNDLEFLELINTGPTSLDLTNVRFTQGISFEFAGSDITTLLPGQRIVIVSNFQGFEARYGSGITIAGQYSGQLSNSGEILAATYGAGTTIFSFEFNDNDPWPGRPDGGGSSLEVIDVDGDYNEPSNWRASNEYLGSPGQGGTGPITDVIINEVLSAPGVGSIDFIELFNTSPHPIDISGWYLSDSSGQYTKYRIPDGTILLSGAYRVFDEDDFNPTPQTPGPNDFGLSGVHGDDVWLLRGNGARPTSFADHVEFIAAETNISFGRVPNGDSTAEFFPNLAPTPGAANSGPRFGPVIFSEVMYQPVGGPDLEFIEIYNSGKTPVDLSDWRLDNAVDFYFPLGTTINGRSTLVILPFDPLEPLNAQLLADFQAAFGLAPDARFLGQYFGSLDNDGERLRLLKPLPEPANEPGFIPYALADEIRYRDTLPWAVTAAGGGRSLHRIAPDEYGNASATWPGRLPSPGAAPGDINGDGVITSADIDALYGLAGPLVAGSAFDLDDDGDADGADAQWLVTRILGTFFGDADLNCAVSIGDLTILAENFGGPGLWAQGDFNGDGAVSIGDLTLLAENFGSSAALVGESLEGHDDAAVAAPAGLQALGDGDQGPDDEDEEADDNALIDILADLGDSLR